MSILYVIAIAQALFFCLFLMTKKGKKILRGLLAVWLVLIGFSLFLSYLYETGKIIHYPHLIGLDTAFTFLYMPIMYIYAKFSVTQSKNLQWTEALHLLPFVIYFIYVSIFFYTESPEYKLAFLKKLFNSEIPLDIQISNLLKIGQAVIYIVLIFRIIRDHQKRIELNFSYTESINLQWLKTITVCLSVIYALKFMGVISIYFNPDSVLAKATLISDLAIILFVYIIAFFGIKQPDIFANWGNNSPADNRIDIVKEPVNSEPTEREAKSKYQGSNLSTEESEKLLTALQQYMNQEKPYLQNQITIKDVAETLQVNSKHLSQVINQQLGLNFFNYINKYRVNEFKKRISDPRYKHLSFLGIALDCGFNSKSSFNSVFKKVTGTTPTDYKLNI